MLLSLAAVAGIYEAYTDSLLTFFGRTKYQIVYYK